MANELMMMHNSRGNGVSPFHSGDVQVGSNYLPLRTETIWVNPVVLKGYSSTRALLRLALQLEILMQLHPPAHNKITKSLYVRNSNTYKYDNPKYTASLIIQKLINHLRKHWRLLHITTFKTPSLLMMGADRKVAENPIKAHIPRKSPISEGFIPGHSKNFKNYTLHCDKLNCFDRET